MNAVGDQYAAARKDLTITSSTGLLPELTSVNSFPANREHSGHELERAMKVDDAFLEDAVLNIYGRSIYGRSDRSLSAGASLDMETLREEWRDYNLRHDDLEQALALLTTKGDLLQQMVDGDRCFAMTEKGLKRGMVGRGRSPRSIWQTVKDLVKLTAAQDRHQHDSGAHPQRRRTDMPPP